MPLSVVQASIDSKLVTNFFLYTIYDVVFYEYAVRMAFLDHALLAHGDCPYHISTEAAAARFGILDHPESGRPGYVRLSSEMGFVNSYCMVGPKYNCYNTLYVCSPRKFDGVQMSACTGRDKKDRRLYMLSFGNPPRGENRGNTPTRTHKLLRNLDEAIKETQYHQDGGWSYAVQVREVY